MSGRYFAQSREKDVTALARDDALAARLWAASERQTGLESA